MKGKREVASVGTPTLHITIFFTLTAFVAIILISFIFRIEVVARGTGKVIPDSRVQVLQSEFDGKISSINVRNGSSVRQGDVLIELDTSDSKALVNTLLSEKERLHIESHRIDTLIERIAILASSHAPQASALLESFTVPHELSDHPYYFQQQKLLSSETSGIQALLQQNRARISSNSRSVELSRAQIERVEDLLNIQEERVEVAKNLLDRGVSSRFAFLEVKEEEVNLRNSRNIYLKELDEKRVGEDLLIAERNNIIASHVNQLQQRRAEIDARLAILKEQLHSARRRVAASQLVAPIDGLVDQLRVFTIGGIVRAGEELLNIVSSNQEIEIEAIFSNQDIGFLTVGQQANIRLDAFPAARFGLIEGRLTAISADAFEMQNGEWGFLARIAPDQTNIVIASTGYQLKPGMTLSVDIITDDRKIISYFFAPILKTIQESLGEL